MSKVAGACALALASLLVVGCASPAPTVAPTSVPTTAPTVVATPAASVVESPAPSPAALTLSLEARDLSFTPKQLEALAGEPFELTMRNAGAIVHNVTIDAPGVQLVVSPGRTASVVVGGLAPGAYPFYCSVSGHRQAGMEGTLTVR